MTELDIMTELLIATDVTLAMPFLNRRKLSMLQEYTYDIKLSVQGKSRSGGGGGGGEGG